VSTNFIKLYRTGFFCTQYPPAVDDTFSNGAREAHRAELEDRPILLKLERAGKLTFHDDDIRERFQRMKPAG
jgi:hypothetical protein